MEQPLWKTVWRFLKKLKFDPGIPPLGIYTKEIKSLREISALSCEALFTTANVWQQHKCPLIEERALYVDLHPSLKSHS